MKYIKKRIGQSIILSLLITLLLIGCSMEPHPIEKYKGKGYVIIDMGMDFSSNTVLQVKNSETITEITILQFDAKNYKVGDTIK